MLQMLFNLFFALYTTFVLCFLKNFLVKSSYSFTNGRLIIHLFLLVTIFSDCSLNLIFFRRFLYVSLLNAVDNCFVLKLV